MQPTKLPPIKPCNTNNNTNTKSLIQYTRKRKKNHEKTPPKTLLKYSRKLNLKTMKHAKMGVGDIVEVFHEEGWRKGRILGVLSGGLSYIVGVLDHGLKGVEVEVCGSHLRVLKGGVGGGLGPGQLDHLQSGSFHTDVKGDKTQLEMEQEIILDANSKLETVANVRNGDNGNSKKLRIKLVKRQLEVKFNPGTIVEVRSDEDGFQGSWYAATIVSSDGTGRFLVEYQTLKTNNETELLKEVANEYDIRPCPPKIAQTCRYTVLEEVDVWQHDGWWEGVITEVLDDWKYVVYFASINQKSVYQHSNLRRHQNWVNGKWTPASQAHWVNQAPGDWIKCIELIGPQKMSSVTRKVNFTKGMVVEVRNDEDGYGGAWYTATIIGLAKDKLLVEFDSLKTNDNKQPLREEVFMNDVRPSPPVLRVGHYKLNEEVDVWCDGGWWVGVISKVLIRKRYMVHFASTNNEKEVDHVSLRPHQEWIDGKWRTITYKKKSPELEFRASSSKSEHDQSKFGGTFGKGTMVEVRSDEPGYEGSWFSALIVKSKKNGKYEVEYLTLKTDDEKHNLREEADAQNIRPFPPSIQVSGRYHLHEIVDAWYNDGWWVGVISEVQDHGKYMVYFKTTRDEMEFDRVNLRPHHEWVNGKWISADKGTDFSAKFVSQSRSRPRIL